MNGFINLYKERSYTSHDCVAKLRVILKQKKIGHMGTLDPDACGVLPVALGKATRLIELFDDDKKTYRTGMLLGTVTDTLDRSGEILEEKPVNVTEEEVRECILSFLGEQLQVPPMYSALKKDGKKLYELARAGITVEREPRNVTFYEISGIETDLPHVRFDVTCSRGTYIRSLCDDIGKKLGCGACMETLERLSVGRFGADNAKTIDEIRELVLQNRLEEAILPMTAMFPDMPGTSCEKDADMLAHNGNPISMQKLKKLPENHNGMFWLSDSEKNLVGIYKTKGKLAFPVKMVYENAVLQKD